MGKTGNQILKLASALIYEGVGDDKESSAFTIDFLNVHLQECLAAENSIRRSNGETELTEAPWLTSLETTIPYHDPLTRIALPYACVSHFYAEAMNEERAQYFDAKYENAKATASVWVEEDIVDAYATEG